MGEEHRGFLSRGGEKERELPVRQVEDPLAGNRAWWDSRRHKGRVGISVTKTLMVAL